MNSALFGRFTVQIRSIHLDSTLNKAAVAALCVLLAGLMLSFAKWAFGHAVAVNATEPEVAALGVDLSRLLIVRPRAPAQLVWSAVQLCRSGAFSCVVLDLTHTGVRLSLAEGKKLVEAAGKGGTALVLLTPPEAPGRSRCSPTGTSGTPTAARRSTS